MPRHRNARRITPWEAGQEMIEVFDLTRDKEQELRDHGYEELADALGRVADVIAQAFNATGSHEFLLGVKNAQS